VKSAGNWRPVLLSRSRPHYSTRRESCTLNASTRGVEGSFFGLVDDQGHTIRFSFEGVADPLMMAAKLRIALINFPQPQMKGSYEEWATIREVHGLIEKAFEDSADCPCLKTSVLCRGNPPFSTAARQLGHTVRRSMT
jgi:hypothetical protein